jgi:hypothetical protein
VRLTVTRLAVRLAVVAFLAATAGLGVPGSAQAATCGTAHGVTVVVDFHQLGGGVQTACDRGGAGQYADQQVTDVGHTLTYAQREPGFVCRVDGSPSTDPCVNTSPADAYWSLWWSDGKSGTWSYSSTGLASLKVPAGGYVALSWQGSSAKAPPRLTPKAHGSAPPPSSPTTSPPSSHPTTAPTSHPTESQSASASSSTPSTTPSSGTTRHPGGGHHAQATSHHSQRGPSTSGQQADPPANRAATSTGGWGLPAWVAPSLIALLFLAAVAVAVVRRKRTGGA